MSDLRKAAEMALEPIEFMFGENHDKKTLELLYGEALVARFKSAIQALRQALAMEKFSEVNQEIEEALKQPKPVAFLTEAHNEDGKSLGYIAHTQFVYDSFPVYSLPTPLQGLTDEDMKQIKSHNTSSTFDFINGAKWAEQILMEKNT